MDGGEQRRAEDARLERIAARLLPRPQPIEAAATLEPDWRPERGFSHPPVPAAVLIALLRRPEGLQVLYTERSSALRAHSGQVAFPGGKLDATDTGPAAAALREAAEEVGLQPADSTVLGYMPLYFTGSNYLITPVVAVVEPTRPFVLNPTEVTETFEVPLRRLILAETFGTFEIRRGEQVRTSWQIDHQGHRIWGITANLTRLFADLALAGEAPW